MRENTKVTSKKTEAKKDNNASLAQKKERTKTSSPPFDQILHLQRTIGNQAVQRLFKSGVIQAKLRIGKPGDKYEQEADSIAEQVMHMPEPKVLRQLEDENEEEELIQPKPFTPQITPLVQRQIEPEEEEEEEEEETLQAKRRISQTSEVTPNLESRIKSFKGKGQPLPKSTRDFFEPRFGRDFSQVKVHKNMKAVETSKAINAKAFTIGSDIVFSAGQYSPETTVGKRLMAHELTHTIQQNGDKVQRKLPIGQQDNRYDQDAYQVGRSIMQRKQQDVPKEVYNGLHQVVDQIVQLKDGKKISRTKFKPMVGKEAEEEFEKRKAKYKKEGKSEREAAFLAIDDMFAERVKSTGGERLPGTATLAKLGEKTYLNVSTSMVIEGMVVKVGFYNTGIDDKSYNCHSFTFKSAKVSKLAKLKSLAKTIPKEPVKGEKYYDAMDLIKNKIHFVPVIDGQIMIFPRWIINLDEIKNLLKVYRPRKAREKLTPTKGDIAMYSNNGSFPHSGKVSKVDAKGNPIKIKGKFGHYSLFEHDPEAVPTHYGKPSYFRKK